MKVRNSELTQQTRTIKQVELSKDDKELTKWVR